jgi:hypothetical protein
MSFVFVPLVYVLIPNETIPCPSPDLSCLFPRLSFFVSLSSFLVSHPFVPRHPSLILRLLSVVSVPSSHISYTSSVIHCLTFLVSHPLVSHSSPLISLLVFHPDLIPRFSSFVSQRSFRIPNLSSLWSHPLSFQSLTSRPTSPLVLLVHFSSSHPSFLVHRPSSFIQTAFYNYI